MKIWMGWLKRESGSAGFRQTNGDSGNAYGLMQFDRRYALVPFMQYCVDFSARYDAFKPYIAYGAGSTALKNNASLAAIWKGYCDSYPEEFEQLQIAYGYQYYFLEAVKYMSRLYEFDITTHSPAVLGTLWSMAIRSGALCAARKFAGCTDSTPESTMLNLAYSTYSTEDAGRWTMAGQWGDALDALANNEYTDIITDMTTLEKTEEKEDDETMAKKKVLIIAGHGKNYDGSYDPGACSKWGEEATFTRELATLIQNSIGKSLEVTMYPQSQNCYSYSKNGKAPVYSGYDYVLEIHFNAKAKKDPNGNGYFTGVGGYYHPNNGGKSIADAMVSAIAALGFKKWQNCTSTGLLNLNRAQNAGVKYFLLETAFIDDGDDMKWYTANKAKVAQAVAQTLINKLGGSGTASTPAAGTTTTKETVYRVGTGWNGGKCVNQFGAYVSLDNAKKSAVTAKDKLKKTHYVFDPDGKKVYTAEYKTTKLYTVQVGAYSVKSNAEKMKKQLENAKYDAILKTDGKLYRVQVGAYSKKENAEAMQKKLKAAGYPAIIK